MANLQHGALGRGNLDRKLSLLHAHEALRNGRDEQRRGGVPDFGFPGMAGEPSGQASAWCAEQVDDWTTAQRQIVAETFKGQRRGRRRMHVELQLGLEGKESAAPIRFVAGPGEGAALEGLQPSAGHVLPDKLPVCPATLQPWRGADGSLRPLHYQLVYLGLHLDHPVFT